MEIRSGKATKSQKILYSAMLLIHFGFLISGIKATVKEIENKRLLVLTLQCLPIKDTVREIENVEKEIGLIILINAVFFSLLYDHDKMGYYGIDRGECGLQSE